MQVIINFKWNTYTYRYFRNYFVLWLLFNAIFIIDISFCNKNYGADNDLALYFSRGICQFILLWFFKIEIRELFKNRWYYFSSGWNVCDLVLQLVYPAYILVSFLHKSDFYVIKSFQSAIIMLSFIKLLFFLRIFKNLSFLI